MSMDRPSRDERKTKVSEINRSVVYMISAAEAAKKYRIKAANSSAMHLALADRRRVQSEVSDGHEDRPGMQQTRSEKFRLHHSDAGGVASNNRTSTHNV